MFVNFDAIDEDGAYDAALTGAKNYHQPYCFPSILSILLRWIARAQSPQRGEQASALDARALVAIRDPPAFEVIGRNLEPDTVA